MRSRLGADQGEIADTRISNPLLYVHKIMIGSSIVRRDSELDTLYATFAAPHERVRGGARRIVAARNHDSVEDRNAHWTHARRAQRSRFDRR